MYTAFQERRLNTLKEAKFAAREGALTTEINTSPALGGLTAAAVYMTPPTVDHFYAEDVHVVLENSAKKEEEEDESSPPAPVGDVLKVISLIVSRPGYRPLGAKSLSVFTDDIRVTEDPRTDVDDKDEIETHLLPMLFSPSLRHFELEGPRDDNPEKKSNGEVAEILISGMGIGKYSLTCLAMRFLDLGRRDGAVTVLCDSFLRANDTLMHLDLLGNDLSGEQVARIRECVSGHDSAVVTLRLNDPVPEAGPACPAELANLTPNDAVVMQRSLLDTRYQYVPKDFETIRTWIDTAVVFILGSPIETLRSVADGGGLAGKTVFVALPGKTGNAVTDLIATQVGGLLHVEKVTSIKFEHPKNHHHIGDSLVKTLAQAAVMLFAPPAPSFVVESEVLAAMPLWEPVRPLDITNVAAAWETNTTIHATGVAMGSFWAQLEMLMAPRAPRAEEPDEFEDERLTTILGVCRLKFPETSTDLFLNAVADIFYDVCSSAGIKVEVYVSQPRQ